jgi:hypothetical protein
MLNKSAIVSAIALLMSVNVLADEVVLPKQPVIPEPLADGQSIEPEINIIQRDDEIVEEYRHNGELYMIKVTPAIGKPYYFVDSDGDGSLETKQFELSSDSVPQWILFKW